MKVLVTGVNGQLGYDVMNELNQRGHEAIGSDITESNEHFQKYVQLDITNKEAVELEITKINPDVVVHCAAWTAVDMAEDDDKVAKVRAINAGGTQNIADVCKKLDCKMTYISTDYVFDGQGTEPWQPDCKDYKPLNVYGQTKLEGELAVSQTLEKYFIVRIAWVFGLNGKNFIKTIKSLQKSGAQITNIVVTDNNIKSFDRVARKYGIDYSLKKVEQEGKSEYLVFFKAKDVDVMTAAFKEYTSETLKKQKRESVRQKLEKVKEELSNHRQLKKEKKTEQEPTR